jgi:hypothetical protein
VVIREGFLEEIPEILILKDKRELSSLKMGQGEMSL